MQRPKINKFIPNVLSHFGGFSRSMRTITLSKSLCSVVVHLNSKFPLFEFKTSVMQSHECALIQKEQTFKMKMFPKTETDWPKVIESFPCHYLRKWSIKFSMLNCFIPHLNSRISRSEPECERPDFSYLALNCSRV